MLNPIFSPFPVLSTPRLNLRRVEPGDAEALFFLRSSEEVMRYIDRPRYQSVQEALDLIQLLHESETQGDGVLWVISLVGQSELIGTIGLWRFLKEHYRAEIGYMLHPAQQGKGIMQEALAAVLDYSFQVLGLHSIEAQVNPENTPSIRLLERNGFVREAYFRENYFFEGRFLDTAVYSRLINK